MSGTAPATVIQDGDNYERVPQEHGHVPVYGSMRVSCLVSDIKVCIRLFVVNLDTKYFILRRMNECKDEDEISCSECKCKSVILGDYNTFYLLQVELVAPEKTNTSATATARACMQQICNNPAASETIPEEEYLQYRANY